MKIKELRDGLTETIITERFPWLLEADFSDAVLGLTQDEKELIWYDGTWYDGTWEWGVWWNGTWKNGVWENGVWRHGVWGGGKIVGGEWR